MYDFDKLSIKNTIQYYQNKKFSCTELTEYFLKKISDNKELNCFITETPQHALNMASNSDKNIKKGEMRDLEGIPIAMKDLFCTKNVKTTAASKILENFVPFYESTVSQQLWESGSVMLGKSNLDEFAMGSANTTSFFGNVKNPIKGKNNSDLVPGGSSGGSAAAVAAGLCLAATGSDTGGSIRQPASFCGIVGMKPTYGRCSRFGMVAFASSLDQAGTLTRDVDDSAIMLEKMCGYDKKDSTSSKREVPKFSEYHKLSLNGKKIGIPKEYLVDGLNPEIKKCWENVSEEFKKIGVEIVDISLPHTKYSLPTYYIIAPAEASANLARYDGVRFGYRDEKAKTIDELYEISRSEGFGAEVKRRIMIGTYVLSAGYYDAYYIKALKVRRLILNDFIKAFETCDLILTPTTPNVSFLIGEKQDDPLEMYLNDVLTVPASLAGLPAISVPAGNNIDELPFGLQIISSHFNESLVFKAAKFIEDLKK